MATQSAPKQNRTSTGAGGLTPCLGGGGVSPRQQMLRFVAGPDGKIYLDLNNDLPGHGAYVRPGLSFFEKALASKALENALGAKWDGTAEDMLAMATKLVDRQILNTLGLLKKAGQVTTGADMVVEALFQDKIQYVLLAADSAENTVKKMTIATDNTHKQMAKACTRMQLEAALGKGNCTVVGLSSRANINEIKRLVPLWQGLKGLQSKA